MKIFLTQDEVLDLAIDYLDLYDPNPDKIQDIADKMDMVYNEELDMWEDMEDRWYMNRVRQISNRVRRAIKNETE
jgi:hypothetical protein